jgi:hypothetical protein
MHDDLAEPRQLGFDRQKGMKSNRISGIIGLGLGLGLGLEGLEAGNAWVSRPGETSSVQ